MYKKIPFYGIFLLGINSIVGSGIFILPTNAYNALGIYSLLAILFTTILTIFFGMSFAEMAGMFPKQGGVYVYAKEVFGDFIGFNTGFLSFFSATMTWSTTAVGFTQIFSAFFPIFGTDNIYHMILPPILIFITAGITLLGVGQSSWTNNLFTIGKMIPLFLFCIIGLFFINPSFLIDTSTVPTNNFIGSFSDAVLIFFFAFSGFEMIPLAAHTMANPTKNLPKAIISVMIFIGLFYTLILIVSIGILGSDLSYSINPLADAFARIFGQYGFYFIWAGSLISVFGLLLASSFEGPYSLSALAKDGFLHTSFAIENHSVPIRSVIFMASLAALISITGSFEVLLKALSFVLLLIFIVPSLAIIKTRKNKRKSRYYTPFYPLIPIVNIILALYLIINTSRSEIVYGITALIFSMIFYIAYIISKKRQGN